MWLKLLVTEVIIFFIFLQSESDCEEEPGAQTTQHGTDIRQFSSTTSTTAGAIDGTTGGAGGGAAAGAIDGLTSASTQARFEFLTAQLQSMFPQTSTSAITQAISNAQNLQGAIDCLLAANRRDIRGIYHIFKLFKVTFVSKVHCLYFSVFEHLFGAFEGITFCNLYEYITGFSIKAGT